MVRKKLEIKHEQYGIVHTVIYFNMEDGSYYWYVSEYVTSSIIKTIKYKYRKEIYEFRTRCMRCVHNNT